MQSVQSQEEAEREIERQERGLKEVDEFLRPRLDRLERNYARTINRLWLGNAGAALATLSFLGATWQYAPFRFYLLMPFGLFVFGLISLGCGELAALIKDARVIRRNQDAESILDIIIGDAESPLEKLGFSFDMRMMLQCASTLLFVAGLIAGLVVFAVAAFGS